MNPYAIVDLHCDTLTATDTTAPRTGPLNHPSAAFSLSKVPRGVRWCQCFAIFIPDGLSAAEAVGFYRRHQQRFLDEMARCAPRVAPCRTAEDIQHAWQADKLAALLSVENGWALGLDFAQIAQLAQDGVGLLSLTWNGANDLASGHDTPQGLSPQGRTTIGWLEAHGILLDVSHLNDCGFDQLLEVARRPFVASHSNARSVCPHRRNLTDAQIVQLSRRGCLIGLNFYSDFLTNRNRAATREDLFAHVVHFLALGAGSCLALGSDFDGAQVPPCLAGPEEVAQLYAYFQARGLSESWTNQILYGNAMAFFQRNLGCALPKF